MLLNFNFSFNILNNLLNNSIKKHSSILFNKNFIKFEYYLPPNKQLLIQIKHHLIFILEIIKINKELLHLFSEKINLKQNT
jgi:hypothetical protein